MSKLRFHHLALAPAVISANAWATTYMTIEQAQSQMFPGQQLHAATVQLSPDQVAAIKHASGEQPLSRQVS